MSDHDTNHAIVRTGRALLDADARSNSTLVDRSIGPIEGAFRFKRILSLADKLAASALNDLIPLGVDQAALVRSMAQMCWIMEDREPDPYVSGRWHDIGQLLYDAAHRLAALIVEEGIANESP